MTEIVMFCSLPIVWLVQTLSSCDQEVLVRALRRPPECSLKRNGLHAVAKLLKDPRGKVSASASSLLRSLADQPRHRERVRQELGGKCALVVTRKLDFTAFFHHTPKHKNKP